MKMKPDPSIAWLAKPHAHDYPAATSFLSLLHHKEKAEKLVKNLRKAKITSFAAKDIFRASHLPQLKTDNAHVSAELKKNKEGEKLSPILLVRDSKHGHVIIADGYHRLCAVIALDENAMVPCQIV